MDLAEIARALDQQDVEQRRRAVLLMAGRKEPEVGALLVRALGDRDFRVREEAIWIGRALCERLDVMPALLAAAAQGENVGLRNAALALLKALGPIAQNALLAELPRLQETPRRLLIEGLGYGKDPRAVRMLAQAAESSDANLVIAAIEGLAQLGGPQAEVVLRKKLAAPSPYERMASIDALARLDATVPFEELKPLLADRMLLRGAVRLLGRTNRHEAIAPLMACLAERSDAVAGAAAAGLLRMMQAELKSDVLRAIEPAAEAVRARLTALTEKSGEAAESAQKLLALLGARSGVGPAPGSSPEPWIALSARGPKLDSLEFRAIAEHMRRVGGIRLTDDTRPSIERRLGERLSALGIETFGDYLRHIEGTGGAPEIERAIEAIATNETYFFRDLPQLTSFERDVLPEVHRLAQPRRSLSVWSAGCSTGEEAYTLAIMLARAERFAGWNLRVFGNDICRRVVQSARRGTYRGASFRAMPHEYASYFEKSDEGATVAPSIRAMCHFARFNLLDSASAAMFGRVNVIFCRNVLIYFDDDARRRVITTFYERLNPGGYLLLGHSDSLMQFTTAFELAHLTSDLAFRKPLGFERTGMGPA